MAASFSRRRRRWIKLAGVALIVILGGILLDQLTAVRPALPGVREGDPAPARPAAGDLPFSKTPLAPTFDERRQAYLRWLQEQPTPDDRGGVWTDIGKLAGGSEGISEAAFVAARDFINERQDPSDFSLAAFVRLYYLQAGSGRLTPQQEADMRQSMLAFKYWLDEPNLTYVEMWTENHQILNHSAEYLAGQLFPDEVFTNNGQDGRWHMQHARPMILRWIDWRARTGFAEWDSIPYYPEDLAALLNLVDFAEDPEIQTRAAMLVDLILFDMASDSFYGQIATSHGRSTASNIKSAAGDSLVNIAALAWGQGRFQSSSNMGVISLATTVRYQVPEVIQALALHNPEEYSNYERHSIPLTAEAAAQYGLSFDRQEDLGVWWGMGAFTNPPLIDLTIRTADEWGLWHYPDFRDLKDIAKALQAVKLLPLASRLLDPDPNGTLSSEVNKVTYRTPDYMLSAAQDYRKGEKGYQQHIWQATLDPYAVVFVTNPDSLRADDRHRPSYWSANGRMPRAAQYRNLLVSLYELPRHPSAPEPLEARHYTFTHAYFPRWAFDEVLEAPANGEGSWIIARRGDGYIALYSHLPFVWTTEGPDADQEIIALGRRNAWLVQMGRRAVDGSFQDFAAAITSAPIEVHGLDVVYQAPGLGEVRFGWEGPLTVSGQEIPLRGYPRWENLYTRAEFGQGVFDIRFEGRSLYLDFNRGERRIIDAAARE